MLCSDGNDQKPAPGESEPSSAAGAEPLQLTDLPEYRSALEAPPKTPAEIVGFRDLWGRPKEFEGRRVRVSGKVVRRFHQPAVGQFPALVEAWAQTSDGNLYCLVYPAKAEGETIAGAASHSASAQTEVAFSGTYLRPVRYRAGDGERVAPVIVGSAAPERVAGGSLTTEPAAREAGPTKFDWTVGVLVGAVVAVALARQHVRRRVPSCLPSDREPPPTFIEPAENEPRPSDE